MLYPRKPDSGKMNHTPPFWVGFEERFFMTICCELRGINQLCNAHHRKLIFDAVEFYHDQRKWYCHMMILMPDHLHAIFSFGMAGGMAEQVRNWKRFLSRKGIKFQDNFFDHRLRSEDQYIEKANYIRENPVRAGRISDSSEWPYIWEPER